MWGYRYSIDFVGGTSIEYQTNKTITDAIVKKVAQQQNINLIEESQSKNIITLRSKPIDEKQEVNFRSQLQKDANAKITTLRFETVGPTIGAESIRKTLIASLIAVVAILLYMSFAFKGWRFALAAILALFHDILVVVGTYSIMSHFFGAELDTLFVTALLTTMSFSVHDTIVIFDKIREYNRRGSGNVEEYADQALSETMVRSINNSATIVFMLLALILMGGSTIRFFIIALLVGTITGTYSSPFVATPIFVWLQKMKKNR